jgi:hypothetical protein
MRDRWQWVVAVLVCCAAYGILAGWVYTTALP